MSADTGVGPSMASGSQICKGIIADLPMPPMKMSTKAQVRTEAPMNMGAVLPENMPRMLSAAAIST